MCSGKPSSVTWEGEAFGLDGAFRSGYPRTCFPFLFAEPKIFDKLGDANSNEDQGPILNHQVKNIKPNEIVSQKQNSDRN